MPKFVFMPPQDDQKREFAARLSDTLPEFEEGNSPTFRLSERGNLRH